MEKHEMMSLEDSGQLRDKMRFFEQELLKNHHIDPNLYVEYNVKRGLRDSAGKGVLTGLTEISDVNGYNLINGRQIPRTFCLSRKTDLIFRMVQLLSQHISLTLTELIFIKRLSLNFSVRSFPTLMPETSLQKKRHRQNLLLF